MVEGGQAGDVRGEGVEAPLNTVDESSVCTLAGVPG